MARVGETPGLDVDLGDVCELEALVVDGMLRISSIAVPLADRLHVIAQRAVLDQPARRGEICRRQALVKVVEADACGGEPIRVDLDLHLARRDALDLHLGDARQPLERPL